jgi:LysM repeat protein
MSNLLRSDNWVSLQVLDDSSELPIEGIKLTLKSSSGETQDASSRTDGVTEFTNVPASGCVIECGWDGLTFDDVCSFVRPAYPASGQEEDYIKVQDAPKSIVRLETHRVKTGETLQSIADKAGLSEEELVFFNFGTTKKEEVNTCLVLMVGCTPMDEEGQEYIFDDSNEPGILYIPHKWERTLDLNMAHGVRVRLNPDTEEFSFSM